MKRFLIMICAAAALVCSCDKYGATLDEISDRIDAADQNGAQLLSKVEALTALAQAQASALTISSVKEEAAGLAVSFSNGNKFVIVDGKDGSNGNPGADGSDGKIPSVVATETADAWTFTFDNGEVITILKTFDITFDEKIEVPVSNEATFGFVLSGADNSAKVLAKGYGVTVTAVDEAGKTITIKAGRKAVEDAYILVSVIRNSDSKIIEKVVPITIIPRQNPKVVFDGASSGYYGQEYSDGTDNYYTQFWKGEVDDMNYFVGEAYSVILDMYAPISEILAIPAGEYKCTDDTAEYTFLIGSYGPTLREQIEEMLDFYELFLGLSTVEEIAEFMGYSVDDLDMSQFESGSELYHQFEDGTYEDLAITDGIVKVEVSGSTYKVTMNLVADDSDWELTYEGEIPVEDHTSGGGGDDGDDPDAQWDTIVADCWGDYYYDDVQEWIVEIYKSANGDDKEFITLDILAPIDATDYIPSGTYTVSDSEEAFTVLPGEYYTWWQQYGFCWDEADSGTLEVINEGDGVYTFTMDFHDDAYGEDWGITITAPVRGLNKVSGKLQPGKPERKDMIGDKVSTSPKDFGKAKYLYEGHKQGYRNPHVPFVYLK